MTAPTAEVPDRDAVREAVEAVLPAGEVLQLPERWRAELAARGPRFESPSSISTFIACPLKWYLDRYAEIPGEPSGFHAVLGSFVHRVLEVFYSEPRELRTEKLLWRTFNVAWDDIRSGAQTGIIPLSLQEEFDHIEEAADNPDQLRGGFYKRARASVDNALACDDDDPGSVDVVTTEKWVRIVRNGITVRGKIDRIRRSRRGGERIEDWKTGRSPADEEPIDVLSGSYIPLGLYVLMRSQGGDPENLRSHNVEGASLLYLKDGRRYGIRVTPTVIAKAELLLDRVTQQMNTVVETGRIPATEWENPCRFCVAQNSCPAWREDGSFDPLTEELAAMRAAVAEEAEDGE